jgi:ferredoxin
MERCPHGRIGFRARPSAAPEQALPDLSRRGLLLAGVSGVLAVPAFDLGGLAGSGPDPSLIRPPGSLDEKRFLARCIRCGQCMRVCPTNVIQPALFQAGIQGIWTPVLDYRLGSSGCQLNCVACGHVCPTAAIRPLAIEEKLGVASFKDTGPVRMGTAFLDRTRCLPWAMNRPCLVCQEVCPVSPKAIYTETVYEPVRNGRVRAVKVDENAVEVAWQGPLSVIIGPGDHFLRAARRPDAPIRRIAGLLNGNRITLNPQPAWDTPPAPGDPVDILVRLQQPHIDVSRCIGCGVCEHECPVSRLRAIRVTSENETRTRRGRMSI